jgi:hypothetical protein
MKWDDASFLRLEVEVAENNRDAGDGFVNHGIGVIQEAALSAIERHKTLPAHQAESYALQFHQGTERLTATQDKMTASHELLPLILPVPLIEANVRQFPANRKRAMTGLEAAE